ncbi:MAG: hypothetical protein LBT97_10995 [Planctomycetota bacterium]|jgi:hypothetical protein|nr:hypothetical protein [Planctomycetota bacterium]
MGDKGDSRGGRAWPALLLPLALTMALAACAWLFHEKNAAGNDALAAAAKRLERYARQEAGELLAAAAGAVDDLVSARGKARLEQESAMRLEVRGVMDSLCRMLSSALEKNRRQGPGRREIGSFPSGFDGFRRFLEIMPDDGDGNDYALAALQAHTPEIAALLPSGYALTVVEDHAREMLRIGAVRAGEGFIGAAVVRDLMFGDGGGDRRWTVKLELTATDRNPPIAAGEMAEHLDRRLGHVRHDDVAWRGWLIAETGEVAASFPEPGRPDRGAIPFIDGPGEWKELDGERLLWLERSARKPEADWDLGVSVAIPVPGEPMEFAEALLADGDWSLALGGLAALSVLGWVRAAARSIGFFRAASPPPRRAQAQPAPQPPPRRRVVLDEDGERGVPEVRGVIVADLPGDGKAHIEREPPARRREEMPSGSLARLQAIHRGKKGGGSRILDQARSPLLRKLAERVRPADPAAPMKRREPPAMARDKAQA